MWDSFGYLNDLTICVALGFRVVLASIGEEFQILAEQKNTEGYSKSPSWVFT
jgi:hypothetical protein